MADVARLQEIVEQEHVETTVNPSWTDWATALRDALDQLGLDSASIETFFEALRPVVFVAVLIVLVAILVRVIRMLSHRTRPAPDATVVVEDVPAGLRPLGWDDLQALADLRQAMAVLWIDLARRSTAKGHGQWHPDATPGEYLRSLGNAHPPSGSGPSLSDWREFTRAVEHGVYGRQPPTTTDLRAWWERTEGWR
jgi:hypothetical protein